MPYKPLPGRKNDKEGIVSSMGPRHQGAILIVSGSIGCVGFLSGVGCGILGYQAVGVDLCIMGFVGTIIGGTVAKLYWHGKD